jgi:sortase A
VGRHKKSGSTEKSWLMVFGVFVISAATICGAYFAFQLWGTNIQAQRNWNEATLSLKDDFDLQYRKQLEANSVSTNAFELRADPNRGDVFGIMYASKIWPDGLGVPIYEGTSDAELDQGIGRYEDSDLPGVIGNFAVAGHRATHGQPFEQFELFEIGDEIKVETLAGTYIYSLIADQIVQPKDVWVKDKRPKITALEDLPVDAKLITLTTCEPKWSSEKRWIWFGVMTSFEPRTL